MMLKAEITFDPSSPSGLDQTEDMGLGRQGLHHHHLEHQHHSPSKSHRWIYLVKILSMPQDGNPFSCAVFRATGQAKKKHTHTHTDTYLSSSLNLMVVNRWLCEFLLSPLLGGTLSEHGTLERFQKGVRQFLLSKEGPPLSLPRKRKECV